jgi:WD40 repeat protein
MSPPPPLTLLPPAPDRSLPPRWQREARPFAVSPDGALFTGPSDGGGADGSGPTLGIWTVAGGDRPFHLDLAGEPALCAAFLADGKRVAVGSADGAVRVFELATGGVRHTLRGHRGPVLCLAASADGKHLVSGGLDTTAVVWAIRD